MFFFFLYYALTNYKLNLFIMFHSNKIKKNEWNYKIYSNWELAFLEQWKGKNNFPLSSARELLYYSQDAVS